MCATHSCRARWGRAHYRTVWGVFGNGPRCSEENGLNPVRRHAVRARLHPTSLQTALEAAMAICPPKTYANPCKRSL